MGNLWHCDARCSALVAIDTDAPAASLRKKGPRASRAGEDDNTLDQLHFIYSLSPLSARGHSSFALPRSQSLSRLSHSAAHPSCCDRAAANAIGSGEFSHITR